MQEFKCKCGPISASQAPLLRVRIPGSGRPVNGQQATPASRRITQRSPPCRRVTRCSQPACVAAPKALGTAQQQPHTLAARREALLAGPAALLLTSIVVWSHPSPALANGIDAARKFLRPDDLSASEAVVVLLDARSVLRDIVALASTPQDSQERFRARVLWPGFAKRLREVGPAAPVVARLVAGMTDKEQTISALYGGKSEAPGLTDELYLAFGRVLTISGRTIRPEAQAEPSTSQAAQQQLEALLSKVPKDVIDQAQAFRVKRAAAAATSAA